MWLVVRHFISHESVEYANQTWLTVIHKLRVLAQLFQWNMCCQIKLSIRPISVLQFDFVSAFVPKHMKWVLFTLANDIIFITTWILWRFENMSIIYTKTKIIKQHCTHLKSVDFPCKALGKASSYLMQVKYVSNEKQSCCHSISYQNYFL